MPENTQHIYTEVMAWEGEEYVSELMDSTDFSDLDPVTQVQAVCFYNQEAVLYQGKDGNYGLPGGTVETGESYGEALKRELREEAAVRVLEYKPLLYARTYKQAEPEKISFQLRYWAEVEPLDRPVDDPDGKAVKRVLCDPEKAPDLLGWGRKAEIYFAMAKRRREE